MANINEYIKIINKLYYPTLKLQEQIIRANKLTSPEILQNWQQIQQITNFTSDIKQFHTMQNNLDPLLKLIAQNQAILEKVNLPLKIHYQFEKILSNASKISNSPLVYRDVSDPELKLKMLENAILQTSSLVKESDVKVETVPQDCIPKTTKTKSVNWKSVIEITIRIIILLITLLLNYPQFKDSIEEILQDVSSILEIRE